MVSTRSSSVGLSPDSANGLASSPEKRTPARRAATRDASPSTTSSRSSTKTWSHTPTHLTLAWLAIAIPVVLWDTGYILMRPHTFAGGRLHAPLWTPYALYQTIDYVYGLPSYEEHDGWPSAQGFFNLIETSGYIWYMWMAYSRGIEEGGKGKKSEGKGVLAWAMERRRVEGVDGAAMVVGLFAISVVTVAKTMLYGMFLRFRDCFLSCEERSLMRDAGLNEYFSGWKHIGHNSAFDIILLWILPK